MPKSIPRKNIPLIKEAVEDWRKGELSDKAAMIIISRLVNKPRKPSKSEIRWAKKLATIEKGRVRT